MGVNKKIIILILYFHAYNNLYGVTII